MLMIDSNIARAFSLVGPLSIIRFRSFIKDPRDVGFIFFAMTVGMAIGAKFYVFGMFLTVMLSGIVFTMAKWNLGAKPFAEVLLKIVIGTGTDYQKVFRDPVYRNRESQPLLSMDAISGELLEVIYFIRFKRGVHEATFLDELKTVTGTQRVSLVQGLGNINV